MDGENDEDEYYTIEKKNENQFEGEIASLATSGKRKVRIIQSEIVASQPFHRELSNMIELEIIECIIKDRALKDQTCNQLKRLTINDSHIQFEDIAALKMDSLECLNLRDNEIMQIDPSVFENMKMIKILDLSTLVFIQAKTI